MDMKGIFRDVNINEKGESLERSANYSDILQISKLCDMWLQRESI